MTSVIVSAFIYLNTDRDKSLDFYVNKGKQLIEQPVKKVIFMDSNLIDLFESDNLTTIIPTTFSDIYLTKFNNLDNTINSTNYKKDTYDYFKIQCNKTEWMRQAIDLFPEENNFIWVDFGIFHIFKNVVPDFNKNVEYQNIRIPCIWNLKNKYPYLDITRDIHWYFCGGVFGGNKNSIIKFADLVKAKCTELMDINVLMWEVNVWYLVYLDHPDLFNEYYTDHCIKMITDY
jgi:hypothetical protein